MEWFKHLTSSHEDPDISDAWDEFGDAGVVVFWTTLEVYGREFSHINGKGQLHLSIKYFERKLRRKWKNIQKILEFYQERSRIFYSISNSTISLSVPKYIEVASNWTKRTTPIPQEVTHELPQEAPQAKEVEGEEEVDKKETYIRIFDLWNSKKIVVHEKFNDKDRTAIRGALREFDTDKIIYAIESYATVLLSENHFFKYKWTLREFMKRGVPKFTPEADPLNNFIKRDSQMPDPKRWEP